MPATSVRPQRAGEVGLAQCAIDRRTIAVCGLLFVGVLAIYWPTSNRGFLNWDDNAYVYNETHVAQGLSWANARSAILQGPAGDWCPLAMLSHMLDCQLYGIEHPGGHHLTNVLLHAASAVIIFLALRRMTGQAADDLEQQAGRQDQR